MRKALASFAAVAVLALICGTYSFAGDAVKSDAAKATIGSPAPSFSLQDQDGKTVALSDFKGKTVVLEWFNNECPYVVRHYKDGGMNSLASKYAGKDVIWLSINSTKGKTNADNKTIAGEWKIDRPILNDATGATGHLYNAQTTPHMYIIDKNGVLAYNGGIDNDQKGNKSDKVNYVSKALDEILGGSSVTEPQTKPYGCSVKYAD
jgi:peroxiredoxin